MKILIVNTYYYPNMIGGTENSIKILAENLYKEGNEVAVYTADSTISNIKIDNINNIKIYRGNAGKYKTESLGNIEIGKIRKLRNKILEINNVTAKKEIKDILDDFKPDIIHTNNLFGISNIIWKIAKEEYKIPVIHTLRDYWMLYPIVSREKLSKILFQPFMKSRTRYVDIVTAPSKYTLNKFIEEGYFQCSKKQCVYNAININLNETKEIIENKKKRNDNNIRFMYVGMLTENKGIRNLLEAFSTINNRNISLHIYGQGALKEFVNNRVKEDSRIKYYGQLSSEDLKKEWIKNDVLIVPSVWEEPFGRVVIEGNQYGLPVIGTNRAGILETINNIHTGITYKYDSIEELKNSIIYFIDRENIKMYYESIVNNIDKYSIQNQIKEFVGLYSSMLSSKERDEN